jgi:hypothetical protein
MKPSLRARCRVDKAGENKAAWAKATSSAGVAEPSVGSAKWFTAGGAGVGVGRGKCHNNVLGVRCPVRTTVSLMETFTSVVVNAMEHPASHNWPMERDEGGGGEFGDEVNAAGSRREHRQIEVGLFMCQSHNGTIGIADRDRIEREAFVDDRIINGSKVGITRLFRTQ